MHRLGKQVCFRLERKRYGNEYLRVLHTLKRSCCRCARPISSPGVSNLLFYPSPRPHAIIECLHFAHAPAYAAWTREFRRLKEPYLPYAFGLVLGELFTGLAFHGYPIVTHLRHVRQLHRAPGEHNHAKDQKEQFQDYSPGSHQVAADIPPTRLLSLINLENHMQSSNRSLGLKLISHNAR